MQACTKGSGGHSSWIRIGHELSQVLGPIKVVSTGQLVYTNQAKIDEELFPYRNKEMIEGRLAEDGDMNIQSQEIPEVKWIQYTPDIDLMAFEKVHTGDSGGHTFSDQSHSPIST